MRQLTFDEYLRYSLQRIELAGSIQADKLRIENLKSVLRILAPDLNVEPVQTAKQAETIEYHEAQIPEPKPVKKAKVSKKESAILLGYENQMAEFKPAKKRDKRSIAHE